jgi:tryptophanyl-tRNA synthetase
MYGEPNQELLVPVGEDQAPHVELTREIVRRFNAHFGLEIKDDLLQQRELFQQLRGRLPKDALDSISPSDPNAFARLKVALRKHVLEVGYTNLVEEVPEAKKFLDMSQVLREPAYLAAETPRLPGLDGRRMAKSYGNAIWLSDPPAEIRTKILKHMVTDPQRVRRTDPGRPEVCPVFAYHKLFSPPDVIAWSDQGCRTAGIGCVECKNKMADNLVKWIEPIQTRRKEFEAHPQQVWDILDAGSDKARKAAKRTMQRVRNAIFKWDDARRAAKA